MKKILIIAGIVIAIFTAYFVGTGFVKNTSVFIENYSLSEDGGTMTVKIGVASSMGFVRTIKSHNEDELICIDCYSAFGGINGRIGAKDIYSFHVDEKANSILINKGNGKYEEVLVKGEDSVWRRPKELIGGSD